MQQVQDLHPFPIREMSLPFRQDLSSLIGEPRCKRLPRRLVNHRLALKRSQSVRGVGPCLLSHSRAGTLKKAVSYSTAQTELANWRNRLLRRGDVIPFPHEANANRLCRRTDGRTMIANRAYLVTNRNRPIKIMFLSLYLILRGYAERVVHADARRAGTAFATVYVQ